MTQTIRSASVSSRPTTTFENTISAPDADQTESAPVNCLVYEFTDYTAPAPPPPAKHTRFDQLLAQWENDNQRQASREEARRWLADAFYGEDGDTVRTVRLRKGWSQARLAQEMGTSQSHVARIERGSDTLSIDTCRRLCQALNVDMNALDAMLRRQEAIFQSKANRK